MEDFTYKGEWFLPNDKTKRLNGTLSFNKDVGISLELFGSFKSKELNLEIIQGITSDSRALTLYKCRISRIGGITFHKDAETGIPATAYSIINVLEGHHFDTVDDLKFTSIEAEIHNMPEWVGITGFTMPDTLKMYKKSLKHSFEIKYKIPRPITFNINEKIRGTINFRIKVPGLKEYDESQTLKQSVQSIFDFTSAENLEYVLKALFSFEKFLMLALYLPTYSNKIYLFIGTGDKKIKVKLFFEHSRSVSFQKVKYGSEMVFSYYTIKKNFKSIIKKWYQKYDILEPAFDLLIEQFYRHGQFTVNTFLNLAQAAETFHARTDNHTRMPKKKYEKMKADVNSLVPKKYHDWLQDQFSFGNNLNLHARLTDITKKYSFTFLDKILNDKEQFVKQVKWSRNYYTHYSASGKKNALAGAELFYLSEKLKLVLVCAFLIEIGIKKEILQKTLESNKYKMFYGLSIPI